MLWIVPAALPVRASSPPRKVTGMAFGDAAGVVEERVVQQERAAENREA